MARFRRARTYLNSPYPFVWGFLALAALFLLGCGGRIDAAGEPSDAPPPAAVDVTVVSESAAAALPVARVPTPPRVVDGLFWSASLGRNMPLSVYLPKGYDNGGRRYPVLYMLHGLGGSQTDWQRWGLFDVTTKLVESGAIPPMIIVAPAGESGYWMDQFNGPRYGSYISQDLVAYIDASYATRPTGAFRAIGGMSMGAHGALQLALNNAGEFSIVGAHSLVVRNKQQAFPFMGDAAYFPRIDPVSILARDPSLARGLRIWIDIGRGDGWFNQTNAFHNQLVGLNVAHVWNAWDGGHDSTYCASHLADYMRFYGDSFTIALDAARILD